jgi:hypothetical protein
MDIVHLLPYLSATSSVTIPLLLYWISSLQKEQRKLHLRLRQVEHYLDKRFSFSSWNIDIEK